MLHSRVDFLSGDYDRVNTDLLQ